MTPPFLRHLCIIIPAIVLTFGNQYQSYSGKDQLELFRKIEEARLNYNVSTSPNETADKDNGNNSVDTTRESRSQKQIIIIPKTKGEMRFGLPKVYLTAGVATQTRVKGGGGGGSGGWGSGGGGIGGGSGGGWGGNGGGGGSGGGWGGNGGGGGSAGWGTSGGSNGGWGGGGGNAIGFGGGGSGWGQSSGRVTGGGGWGGGGNMGGFGGGGGGWGGGMGGGNGGWGGGQSFGNSGGGGGGQGWGWGVSSGGGGGSGGGGWDESMECDKKAQKAKKKAQKKKAKQKKKQMKKGGGGGGGGGGWGGWDRSGLEEPGWMTERSIKIGSVVNNEYDDAVSEESSNEVEIWPNNSPPTRTSRIDPKPNEQPEVHVLDPESFPFLFKSEKSYPNPPSKNSSSISSEELSPGTTSQDDLPKMISLKLICPENPPKSRALWFLNRKSKSIENCVYVQV